MTELQNILYCKS